MWAAETLRDSKLVETVKSRDSDVQQLTILLQNKIKGTNKFPFQIPSRVVFKGLTTEPKEYFCMENLLRSFVRVKLFSRTEKSNLK